MGRAVAATLISVVVTLGLLSVAERVGDGQQADAPRPPTPGADPFSLASTPEAPTTTTTVPETTTTAAPIEIPDIDVQAAAWIVTDPEGRALLGEAPDERRPIASLAKLPLALATVDALLEQTAHTVPASAASVRGRRVGWSPRTEVPTAELLDGLLRTSGNDAALTAAAAVGGSELALTAIRELGGDGIADVAGLRGDTVASPGEIAGWLARALDEPELRRPLEARAAEPLPGQGGALSLGERVPSFVAAKTSWSPAAGRSLAALMRFGDEERLVVVLDATDPAQAAVDAYVLTWFTERAGASDLAAAAG